jgi:hypothetical protein
MIQWTPGFEQLPEEHQIAVFRQLFEEKLKTHVDNLQEFCDSGDKIILLIEACVPGQPLVFPQTDALGDQLNWQIRQQALKIAVHRGILTDAEAQGISPAAMDMNIPKAGPLLDLRQAMAKKAGIDLLSLASPVSPDSTIVAPLVDGPTAGKDCSLPKSADPRALLTRDDAPPERPTTTTIVVIGPTGAGKSSLGNRVLRTEALETSSGAQSETPKDAIGTLFRELSDSSKNCRLV